MSASLVSALRQLRLSGAIETLDLRLQEAASHGLNHAEFLELVLQDELALRSQRLFQRRLKAAGFREHKTLEDFDWSFNPSIKKKQIYDLASGHFIRERRDLLWLGPPGVGKSHLVQAVGYQLLKAGFVVMYRSIFDVVRDFLHDEALGDHDKVLARYLKPDLLIVDDMGMKHLPKRSGEYLFEIIMRRYETRSTIMTSNRPLEDWGKLLGDLPSATAILDRFLHHAEIIRITGKSYRLRHQARGGAPETAGDPVNDEVATAETESGKRQAAMAPSTSRRSGKKSKPAIAPPGSETWWQIQNQPLRSPARRHHESAHRRR
jgi:DNA replication protein DnaC